MAYNEVKSVLEQAEKDVADCELQVSAGYLIAAQLPAKSALRQTKAAYKQLLLGEKTVEVANAITTAENSEFLPTNIAVLKPAIKTMTEVLDAQYANS